MDIYNTGVILQLILSLPDVISVFISLKINSHADFWLQKQEGEGNTGVKVVKYFVFNSGKQHNINPDLRTKLNIQNHILLSLSSLKPRRRKNPSKVYGDGSLNG